MQLSKDILLRLVRQAIVVTVLLACCVETTAAVDSLRVSLHYRQGSAVLDPGLTGNEEAIARMLKIAERGIRVRSIDIVSSASPEGNTLFNKELSEDRSETALSLLAEMFDLDSASLAVSSIGIDWDGLVDRLCHSEMPYADEALAIIRDTPEWVISDGVVTDSRKLRLRRLGDGEAWSRMLDTIFPQLRVSHISIAYSRSLPALPAAAQGFIATRRGSAGEGQIIRHPQPMHSGRSLRWSVAVRTNLLYDALTVPNLGLEVGLGRGWTAGVWGMYAWWGNSDRGRYRRLQGAELSVRKYFSGRPMLGHHIGVTGSLLRYDVSFGSKGQLSGGSGVPFHDHPSWTVGAEYGYALGLTSRLRLDFSIGVGYFAGRYMTYRIADGHSVWQSTRQRRYFGPVKAELSLVYVIGKGGER